jgi:hypothetical protein
MQSRRDDEISEEVLVWRDCVKPDARMSVGLYEVQVLKFWGLKVQSRIRAWPREAEVLRLEW